ncbi:MAG: hypothetical protein EXS08_05175 [Planctomycetes bacterium]|nr:hypothetical protein [Planctomycetota bacterium]
MTETAPVPEELLAHAAFVRKLARSLLQDVNDVEDVEQETWRTVLVRPPGHGQNLRGWLTRVTQNYARRSLRSSARRSEHEGKAVRDGAELSFEAQLAREELLSRGA